MLTGLEEVILKLLRMRLPPFQVCTYPLRRKKAKLHTIVQFCPRANSVISTSARLLICFQQSSFYTLGKLIRLYLQY